MNKQWDLLSSYILSHLQLWRSNAYNKLTWISKVQPETQNPHTDNGKDHLTLEPTASAVDACSYSSSIGGILLYRRSTNIDDSEAFENMIKSQLYV